MLQTEFIYFYCFFIVSLLFCFIAFLLSTVATSNVDNKININFEKYSSYECGFDPFDSARSRFNIHFYFLSLLFIVFDIEVAFLFPWALVLPFLPSFGFWVMMLFLFILVIGFVYEW